MARNCRVPQLLVRQTFEYGHEQESQALASNEDSQDMFPVMIDSLIEGIFVREDEIIK